MKVEKLERLLNEVILDPHRIEFEGIDFRDLYKQIVKDASKDYVEVLLEKETGKQDFEYPLMWVDYRSRFPKLDMPTWKSSLDWDILGLYYNNFEENLKLAWFIEEGPYKKFLKEEVLLIREIDPVKSPLWNVIRRGLTFHDFVRKVERINSDTNIEELKNFIRREKVYRSLPFGFINLEDVEEWLDKGTRQIKEDNFIRICFYFESESFYKYVEGRVLRRLRHSSSEDFVKINEALDVFQKFIIEKTPSEGANARILEKVEGLRKKVQEFEETSRSQNEN